MTFPSIAVCDRCGNTVRVRGGDRLPKGWETDWATGEDRCAECVESGKRLPWSQQRGDDDTRTRAKGRDT